MCKNNSRNQVYSDIVKRGNRKEISMIANTLLREKIKKENNGKKFYSETWGKVEKIQRYINHISFND